MTDIQWIAAKKRTEQFIQDCFSTPQWAGFAARSRFKPPVRAEDVKRSSGFYFPDVAQGGDDHFGVWGYLNDMGELNVATLSLSKETGELTLCGFILYSVHSVGDSSFRACKQASIMRDECIFARAGLSGSAWVFEALNLPGQEAMGSEWAVRMGEFLSVAAHSGTQRLVEFIHTSVPGTVKAPRTYSIKFRPQFMVIGRGESWERVDTVHGVETRVPACDGKGPPLVFVDDEEEEGGEASLLSTPLASPPQDRAPQKKRAKGDEEDEAW